MEACAEIPASFFLKAAGISDADAGKSMNEEITKRTSITAEILLNIDFLTLLESFPMYCTIAEKYHILSDCRFIIIPPVGKINVCIND